MYQRGTSSFFRFNHRFLAGDSIHFVSGKHRCSRVLMNHPRYGWFHLWLNYCVRLHHRNIDDSWARQHHLSRQRVSNEQTNERQMYISAHTSSFAECPCPTGTSPISIESCVSPSSSSISPILCIGFARALRFRQTTTNPIKPATRPTKITVDDIVGLGVVATVDELRILDGLSSSEFCSTYDKSTDGSVVLSLTTLSVRGAWRFPSVAWPTGVSFSAIRWCPLPSALTWILPLKFRQEIVSSSVQPFHGVVGAGRGVSIGWTSRLYFRYAFINWSIDVIVLRFRIA